jgi:NAD(P)-dependent dehydrogenase (short-subunit alcohol dehydrogenase family)
VTDPSSAEEMASRVMKEWGGIDVLVNNAGIYGDHHFDPVLETDPDYWDKVLEINLKGPLLCSRAVAPQMKTQGKGRIVNISSMGAYILGGVYSISKLAVNHLTWSLASELGSFGVTVNAVGPGTMDVPSAHRQNTAADLEDRAARSLVKRIGKPVDIYAAIRYFASDEAEWCTGQCLLVNGGFNVHI